ncbi:GATA zinc finger domain-containing protein [Cucumispora dikerogammari]|nr:GATA zinc finger domain-containing protein [Cucumispora dikerogammari]
MTSSAEHHQNNSDDKQQIEEHMESNNLFTYDMPYKKQIEEDPKQKIKALEDSNMNRNPLDYRPEDNNYMKSQPFFYKPQTHVQQQPTNNPYAYGDFYANNYTKTSFSPQEYEYMASIRTQKEARRKPKIRVCTNCSTTNTPSWRRSKDGRLLLCNACGLYAKLHGRPRPFSKSIDGRTKALKPHFERFTCYSCRLSGPKLFIQSNNGMLICRQCGEPERWSTSYLNYPQEQPAYYQPPTQPHYSNNVNKPMYVSRVPKGNSIESEGFEATNFAGNMLNPKQMHNSEVSYNASSQSFSNFFQNNKTSGDIKPKNPFRDLNGNELNRDNVEHTKRETLGYNDSFFEGDNTLDNRTYKGNNKFAEEKNTLDKNKTDNSAEANARQIACEERYGDFDSGSENTVDGVSM